MKAKTAQFVTGITIGSELPEAAGKDLKHVAFIGRSNVGKSSLINSLVGQKELARSSANAGFTKQINFYLINKSFYLVDLPGYGFAQGSFAARNNLQQLIEWYLTYPGLEEKQLIVLLIDAKVGPTDLDKSMLIRLNELGKHVVVVANKIDKIKKSDYKKQMDAIISEMAPHLVIPYSVKDKLGVGLLTKEIMA
ncbi:MAG TPA: ribosome biogenesis GTP-binding protein YihA/YsxC [Patescibacteria group bacterium]|jgi:GTP-binding protein|nr:ribosome biogenesis GTP-binding protein YihA/YsxC [Patescibacteria group bacterium]